MQAIRLLLANINIKLLKLIFVAAICIYLLIYPEFKWYKLPLFLLAWNTTITVYDFYKCKEE